MSASLLEPGDVGMAADGAGGRAGRIDQHGVERPGLPSVASAAIISACRPSRARLSRSAREPVRRAVDRGDARARPARAARSCRRARRKGRRRACRRRRRTAAPAARRRRPAPTRRLRDSRAAARPVLRVGADRAGRQHAAAQALRPAFGVGLHGEIERRLVPVRDRDRARGVCAVVLRPAREQPGRRVERHGIERLEQVRPFARRRGAAPH